MIPDDRPLPTWFADAKLGVLVHWGPSSVPAFAPVGPSPFALAETHGWAYAFAHTPYAEWYQNSLALDGSPVAEHHASHHPGTTYADFARRFADAAADWDPATWVEPFAAAGARYVVITTKHHDGWCLWPTATPTPHRDDWASRRDLVGDLAIAARAAGLRFGTYYSGGLDWTFGGLGIDSWEAMLAAVPRDDAYRDLARAHVRELVERYRPDVLWNDIHFPDRDTARELIGEYHAAVPEGVVNDRFDLRGVAKGEFPADIVTPEYAAGPDWPKRPWELCRGIGGSFGYNAAETDDDLLSGRELVHLLVEVVAGGGNLLLGVGPAADGSIPELQASRLRTLGAWMDVNSPAIHGTRPDPATAAPDGVWITATDDHRYVIVTDPDAAREVTLGGPPPAEGERSWLGVGDEPEVSVEGDRWTLRLPTSTPPTPALTLRARRRPEERSGGGA